MADHDHNDAHAEHPGVGQYVEIGAILAFLTAIEVALFFAGIPSSVTIPALVVLTIVKFVLVIFWFMHLRFDHKAFRRMFYVGIALALIVFGVVLAISG